MDILLHVVHVLAALALIALVLLQQGKGADAGASFGGGASNTVFGSAGSANFLTRATAICALVFFITSLALAWLAREQSQSSDPMLPMLKSVQEQADVPVAPESEVPAMESQDVPAVDSDVPMLEEGTTEMAPADVESATPAEQPAE